MSGWITTVYLPAFAQIAEGKMHEVSLARRLDLPGGSLVVFDRGYTDYAWYTQLNSKGIYFVTRQKKKRLLRRIGYTDPETGKHYVFFTNASHLAASTITGIHKERWQIELFFKWIKQNLKTKAFLGTSHNAVMTQI